MALPIDTWTSYRDAVRNIYAQPDPYPYIPVDVSEGELEFVASLSDRLTEELAAESERIERHSAEAAELERALVAAAAVDAAVGAQVLSDLQGDVDSEGRVEVPGEVIEATPWPGELEPIDSLLASADAAFLGGGTEVAGAAADRSSTLARSERAIEELLDCATPPATQFAEGALRAGAGLAIPPMPGIDRLHELVDSVQGRLRWGCRLIASAVNKLVALVASETGQEVIADLGLEDWQEVLRNQVETLADRLVRKLTGVARARRQVAETLRSRRLSEGRVSTYDAELVDLCRHFAKNMRSARSIAKSLKLAAVPVIVLAGIFAGGTGGVILAAANGVGLAYSLHGLGDRLDTFPGWVPGVQTTLRDNLAPPTR